VKIKESSLSSFEIIEDLLSIVLFGSKAREDEDDFSDVDIFLLVEDIPQDRISEIIDIIKTRLPYNNIGISLYTLSSYKQLLREGSIFIWHLKLEGLIIYNKTNMDLFNKLAPFNKFNENYLLYKKLFINTKSSLQENGINEYDLSHLFFLCRNICLLTCFKLKNPTFGRMSVYEKLVEMVGFLPLSQENYIFLSKWRLNFTRASCFKLDFPTESKMLKILNDIEDLLSICKEIIENGVKFNEKIKEFEDVPKKFKRKQSYSI